MLDQIYAKKSVRPNILLAVYNAPWIKTHIIEPFRTLNADLTIINLRGINPLEGAFNKESQAVMTKERFYDLIFVVEGRDKDIEMETLKRFKNSGAVLINYLVDTPQDWWRSIKISQIFDYVLSAQTENCQRLKNKYNEVLFFPFAISDEFFHKIRPPKEEDYLANARNPITFLGSAHSRWRWHFVNQLSRIAEPLTVVGSGWNGKSRNGEQASTIQSSVKRLLKKMEEHGGISFRSQWTRIWGGEASAVLGGIINAVSQQSFAPLENVQLPGFLNDDELNELLLQSAAIVSTSMHGSGYLAGHPRMQFKLRDIELSAYGIPHLVNRTPDTIMCLGDDAFYYHGFDELRSCLNMVRNDPKLAYQRAKVVRTIIQNNHLWSNRFSQIAKLTKLNISQ